ncbi:MAG: hypothetical protein AAF602_24170, partial [Myxococcota bacterium]
LDEEAFKGFAEILLDYMARLEKLEERKYPAPLARAFYHVTGGHLSDDLDVLAEQGEELRRYITEVDSRIRVLRVAAEYDAEGGVDEEPGPRLKMELVVRGEGDTLELKPDLENHPRITELHRALGERMTLPAELKAGNVVKRVTSWTETMQALMELAQRGYEIQRYKGLGEMNPEQLWETTMNPETRTLQQVVAEPGSAEVQKTFESLMGDPVEPRRDFIRQNSKSANNLDI